MTSMSVILKALHMVAFMLLLGGPLFWRCLWPVLGVPDSHQLTAWMRRRVRYGTSVGACGLLVASYGDLLRVVSQMHAPVTLAHSVDFLIGTRYGHMTLLKSILIPLLLCTCAGLSLPHRLWKTITLILSSVMLIATVSLTSHAAATPGLAPVLLDALHLGCAVTWCGGLCYIACLPWRTFWQAPETYGRAVRRLVARFSTLALVAVCGVGVSGAVLAFVHVYGLVALAETPYGRFLAAKIGMVLLALGVAGWQVTRLNPALHRQVRTMVPTVVSALLRRCGLLVRIETSLLLGVLLLAALLTTLPPAERPAHLTTQQWTAAFGDWQLDVTLTPTGERGQVQCDLALVHRHGQATSQSIPLWVHLRMQGHDMGTRRTAAVSVAPGRYRLPATISMAGSWEAEVAVVLPQEGLRTTTFRFEAATGSRDQGRSRRLELAVIPWSTFTWLSCLIGLLLGLLAGVTLWASRTGRMPAWATPLGCGLLACGSYLVLRVILVDAYPTTYHPNPLPVTSETLREGRALFLEHCTVCHGLTGQGDGPAAAGLEPRPADLTAAHVDEHTDGDLFWWLTHGMPGTAMPAWQEHLTASARWRLVQHLRALRRSHTSGGAAVSTPAP